MPDRRSIICTTMGHVDHGKSSILDKIRGSAIVNTEPGKITQHVGCSIVPISVIKKVCGVLLDALKMDFTVPGLLFLDTPGHAAFTNLRKRGGNLADIAILVIDINEGFKPQTIESIEILQSYKTPFIIAANKIDLVQGWREIDKSILKNISMQSKSTHDIIETKIYELVGKVHDTAKINAERFDRIQDFTKQIAIVPISAVTGSGIPELLMVITGLAQKYLEEKLVFNAKGHAKGVVIEVKEEKGIGTALDSIIYDGTLNVNDTIVIGGIKEPIVSKVRLLAQPQACQEMRDKKAKFSTSKSVQAATGVRIAAAGIKDVVAGMPFESCTKSELSMIKKEIQCAVTEVLVSTDKEGIVLKGDTLGSLEALANILRENGIKIKKAAVGDINKKDIADAEANYDHDPLKSVILGFNVEHASNVNNKKVKIITDQVIYKLIDDFKSWSDIELNKIKLGKLSSLVSPCKILLMPNYVFRQSNPAILGVDIVAGKLKVGQELINNKGKIITKVKEIQLDKENKTELRSGNQAAVALEKVTIGRQIHEGESLYSLVLEPDFRKLKDLKEHLSSEEKQVLKEIAEIMRQDNVLWGV